ncbi:MAG: T9SS type A sorting domain-containing protein, partial [Chitinophagales bacterium]
DSVFVEWGDPSNSSSYVFEYKLATASDWISIPTTDNFISLDNLIPESVYDYRVRSICEKFTDTSSISTIHQFNTIASSVPLLSAKSSSFTLYPNPASSKVTIELTFVGQSSAVLSLINLLGEIVYEETWNAPAGTGQREITVGNLPSGIYTVKLVSGDSISNKQLVIH